MGGQAARARGGRSFGGGGRGPWLTVAGAIERPARLRRKRCCRGQKASTHVQELRPGLEGPARPGLVSSGGGPRPRAGSCCTTAVGGRAPSLQACPGPPLTLAWGGGMIAEPLRQRQPVPTPGALAGYAVQGGRGGQPVQRKHTDARVAGPRCEAHSRARVPASPRFGPACTLPWRTSDQVCDSHGYGVDAGKLELLLPDVPHDDVLAPQVRKAADATRQLRRSQAGGRRAGEPGSRGGKWRRVFRWWLCTGQGLWGYSSETHTPSGRGEASSSACTTLLLWSKRPADAAACALFPARARQAAAASLTLRRRSSSGCPAPERGR